MLHYFCTPGLALVDRIKPWGLNLVGWRKVVCVRQWRRRCAGSWRDGLRHWAVEMFDCLSCRKSRVRRMVYVRIQSEGQDQDTKGFFKNGKMVLKLKFLYLSLWTLEKKAVDLWSFNSETDGKWANHFTKQKWKRMDCFGALLYLSYLGNFLAVKIKIITSHNTRDF